MKFAKLVALVAVLLVLGYFLIGAFFETRSGDTALDSASATDAGVPDQSIQTVPMPQLSKPLERLPASNAEQVYVPERKAQ